MVSERIKCETIPEVQICAKNKVSNNKLIATEPKMFSPC